MAGAAATRRPRRRRAGSLTPGGVIGEGLHRRRRAGSLTPGGVIREGLHRRRRRGLGGEERAA